MLSTRNSQIHWIASCGLAMLGLLATGCGSSWQAATYSAHGEVFVNGKAADGAFVFFHPTGKDVDVRQSRPWAIVEPDGTYRLRTYELDDGAPVGDYQVTLAWRFDPTSQEATDKLNFAYSKPEQTPWKFTVKSGDNEFPRIELTNVTLATRSNSAKPSIASPLLVHE